MRSFSTAFRRRTSLPTPLSAANASSDATDDADPPDSKPSDNSKVLPIDAAQRILYALMFPAMLMPIASGMSRVALPIIRDDFVISADMTAWVATSFTLPFMILMPVYGRLSNGVGRRRLLLLGMVIFALGTAITFSTTNLVILMFGRAIQGIGAAGFTPLGMAIISSIFQPDQRGKALGTWSSIGPTAAAIAPPLGGLLADIGGWRLTFVPPLLLAVIAVVVIAKFLPAGLSNIQPSFWRKFDWTGAALLGATVTLLLFFLSSRPITGVEPLQDWRLGAGLVLALGGFLWWEQRHPNPFVMLDVFTNRMFTVASCSAALRMMTMAGVGFLTPLFLADIYEMRASTMGLVLMIMPGAMMFMVRFGGMLSDRLGSQIPVLFGFVAQISVALLFSFVTLETPRWMFYSYLALHGFGVGLMLAALHSAALRDVTDEQMGVAAGLYSMIRFLGMAAGTALSGVILQGFFNQSLPMIEAYQLTYRVFAISAVGGLVLAAIGLRGQNSSQ